MTKVHVLCGGNSDEREVSLRSGAAVAKALGVAGYDVIILDPANVSIDEIIKCDVVFPVLHGAGGEDGTLQAEFEKRGIRYVGTDAKASALCFDKVEYKRRLQQNSLPTPAYALAFEWDLQENPLTKKPFVLKPYNGGSSVDTFIVRDPAKAPWEAMLATMKKSYGEMLLEELIEGTELTVGVLGEQVLPVIEIIPPEHGEFDYENKYNGTTQELCPPENVSSELQLAAQELAMKAHTISGCRDFSRTDIMVNTDGALFLLETNTIPGMTDQSLFPKMAATAGIAMPALVARLVEAAVARQTARA